MLKILKKTVVAVSFAFITSVLFITVVEAKEVKCNYGENTVTLKDGSISVTFNNPAGYFSVVDDGLRTSDIEQSDGTYKCPSNLYVRKDYETSARMGKAYFSFVSDTYEGSTAVAFTNGTVDGTDINNPTPAEPTDDSPGGDGGVTVQPSEPINCDDFEYTEAGKTYNILKDIFQIMMMAGPILLIIFGIIDFSKASLASDEQALKKAGSNFVKRAIAAVLLFLIPFIINIIIGIAFDAGVFGDLTEKPATCVTD